PRRPARPPRHRGRGGGAPHDEGIRPLDAPCARARRRRRPRAHPARRVAHDVVRVVEDDRRSRRRAAAEARRPVADRDGARDRPSSAGVSTRLLASYLALTIVVLVALEVPLAIVNARTERKDLTAKVERDAYAAASLAEDTLQAGSSNLSPALQRVAVRYRLETGGRIVIVNRTGRSIADSQPTTPGEREFRTRPEVAAALRGDTASGIRPSETLGHSLLYVAVPVASSAHVWGAVRITYPTSTLDRRVRRYRIALVLVGAIVLAAAAAVGLLLARSFAHPLRRLERVAARVGAGELDARAREDDGPPEVRRLAGELNQTTAKLAALITSQEQFVADASHELRTPLTALRLRLENGETEPALDEAERLARLVDELLALARVDVSASPPEAVDLDDVVMGRVELWEPLASERGVRLA